MAGDVLKDLESYVPQIRDLAGELNGITSTLNGIGNQAARAARQMRDLYDPSNYDGGFEKLTKDAKTFALQMTKLGASVTMKNFKGQLQEVEKGFKHLQQQGLSQMGILGKGLETTFRRMEATGKGFWRSLAKEAVISVKAMASEIFSFKNIFKLGMSVITASLGIVYKSINFVIDACKKAWQITVEWMNNLYAAAGSVAQSLGLSGKAVGQLRGQIESLYISESNLADSMADIATAASAVMTAFRDQTPVLDLTRDVFLMGKAMGISTEGAAKLVFYFDRAWGVKTSKERRLFVSEQLDFANKIGVPHKEMMETLETQKDLISRLGNDGVVAIHRLTAASKAFGISQEKIVTSMAKFDTLEETIPTINKINMLTGAAIDPFLVFAETDPTKKFTYMMESIRRSVGDWKSVDKWTKLSLANITGFTESEMEVAFSAGNMQKAVDDLMKKGEASRKTTEAWNDAVMAAKSFFVSFDRLFRPLFSQISKIFAGLAPTLVKALRNVLTGFSVFLKSFSGKDKALNLLLYGKEDQGGSFSTAITNWSIKLKTILSDPGIHRRVTNFINNVRDTFNKAVEFINKLIEALQKRLPGMMDGFNAFFKTVVDRVQNMLEKIEEYKVLDTLEKVAKTVINLIKFIDQNKVMLLGVLGAFKLAGAVGGFQQAYGSIYGLRNVANATNANSIMGTNYASANAANAAIANAGFGSNNFTVAQRRGAGGRFIGEWGVTGYTPNQPGWGERAYAASQQPVRVGRVTGASRMGAGLGGVMAAGILGAQIYGMATQKERVKGSQIGGAAGGAILGGVGAFFGGPMGAMIGGMIGNTAGKWIGKMLDKEEHMLDSQMKIQDNLKNSINATLEIRAKAEKNFANSLEKLSEAARGSKEKLNSLNDITYLLASSWTEERDASQSGLKLDSKGRAALQEQLQTLLGLGVITKEQFEGLSSEGGTIPMTKEEMENMISKIQIYNSLESERIGILEQSPEILAKRKEKEEEKARKKAKKDIINTLEGAPTLTGQESTLSSIELKKTKSWVERFLPSDSGESGPYIYSQEQKNEALARRGLSYYETKGIDIKDSDTALLLDRLDPKQKKGLINGNTTDTLVKDFLETEGFLMASRDTGIINDLVNLNLKVKEQEELAATKSTKNMEELGDIINVAQNEFKTVGINLDDFPEDAKKAWIEANTQNTKAFKKMLEIGKRAEIAKWTAVQNPLNKLMEQQDLMAQIKDNPAALEAFISAMGQGQGGLVSFFNSLNSLGIIPATAAQGKLINDAWSAFHTDQSVYEKLDAEDLANNLYGAEPQMRDGGPIKTNTVLSTVTATGRLRPYATAGEPGNPESVVPDRKFARTINLNLTVPLTIDGKKITDVVVQRLIPLDV